MTTRIELKQRVVTILDTFPEDTLTEIATFLDHLRYKLERYSVDTDVPSSQQTPYTPVALGGLWTGVTITDEDITEARREMWNSFGE